MKVQSVLFDKSWTQTAAKKWLLAHNFKATKVHVTATRLRYRQYAPKNEKYRTITFGHGVQAIIAREP